jgi:hypothetical protein
VATVVPRRRPFPREALTLSNLGDRVLVFGEKKGILRFIGSTHFESGEWCGIELDLPEGKNDGQILGTDYFHCLPNHGLFVPCHQVELFKEKQPKKFSLCLRDIESGSSTSSSLAENETTSIEDGRSYLQYKARHRRQHREMKPGGALNRPARPRPGIRPSPAAAPSSSRDSSANSRYVYISVTSKFNIHDALGSVEK